MNAKTGIIAAIGVGGAALAGALGVSGLYPERRAPAPSTSDASLPPEPDPICLRADLDYFAGDEAACLTRDDLAQMRRKPVIDPGHKEVVVEMADPRNPAAPTKRGRTCRDYDEMRFDGMYAASSRDMRREAYFIRACGAIDLLERARPPKLGYFEDGRLGPGDAAEIAASRMLQWGEGRDVPLDPTVTDEGDGRWRIGDAGFSIYLSEIAYSDFDADGLGEILALIALAPDAASARVTELALIERDAAEAPLAMTLVSYEE